MTPKNIKPPFYKLVMHLKKELGLSTPEAIDSAQSTYEKFKNRNQRLMERQLDLTNNAQVQLISHFALLATLTLTVAGFLVTQSSNKLTNNQQWLILATLATEIISLFFGAIDYLQTIVFHRRWARLYNNIDTEVDKKFVNRELQQVSDLGDIEAKHLKKGKESSHIWVTYTMVGTCLFGLILMLALFYGYFFDVPIIK